MKAIGDAIARGVLTMAGRRSPWGSGGSDGPDGTGEADGPGGASGPGDALILVVVFGREHVDRLREELAQGIEVGGQERAQGVGFGHDRGQPLKSRRAM